MKKNKIYFGVIIIFVLIILFWRCSPKKPKESFTIMEVKRGDIKLTINANGSVMPQNRLVIKPPLAGRVENVLVKEGDYVKKGQILLYMSSSDRAAILDAARAKGEDLKEWEEIYKPISIIAPISGQIIVKAIEPGQTVNQSDSILVLSDRLIIKAQVDETDIGKVKKGQNAIITLDAYPDNKIDGVVDHIYYESKTVNNVTIYEVDILPSFVPDFLRSGMSANVDIIKDYKKDILLVPSDAIRKDRDGESFLLVFDNKKREKRFVKTGIFDDANTEIVSGVKEGEKILIIKKDFIVKGKRSEETQNPFVPARPGRIRR